MSYTIHTEAFEGPFDLLLFFIERDELDIYDIPISKITEEFLDFLKKMESLNIDLASEFILVAATLMRIKAKMLLPRKELNELGEEIDPRNELVQKLLEYKRYKSILEEMRDLEDKRAAQFNRGNITEELKEIANKALVDVELESITLFKLMKVFDAVMQRYNDSKKQRVVHQIYNYNYSIQDQQNYIFTLIENHKKCDFKSVFNICQDRIHAIVTFLALLELLNLQKISILQGEGINNFWIQSGEVEFSEN
ncbi:MAG: segregation/condensation protein A [Saprospiraceae bacterium]|nr:segregation/condensation protein A [Saprospiraceae bacterium]